MLFRSSGANADVYFLRTQAVLRHADRNPIVTMEVFRRADGATLCGIDEAKALLAVALQQDAAAGRATVWGLRDGDSIAAHEVVLRIRAPYLSFAHLETAYLGAMAHGTGWATAARAIVTEAAPTTAACPTGIPSRQRSFMKVIIITELETDTPMHMIDPMKDSILSVVPVNTRAAATPVTTPGTAPMETMASLGDWK